MARFHAVHDKFSQALDDFAYDELGISDEVKEQACFFFLISVFYSFIFIVSLKFSLYDPLTQKDASICFLRFQ